MFATESCHEMWIRIYGYIKCGCPVRLYETVSQDSWIFNPELQYRAALKQLKQERIKKYEYCLPCESCFNSQFHHHCSRWVMTNCPSPLDLYIILFFDVMSVFCRSNLWTLTYAGTFCSESCNRDSFGVLNPLCFFFSVLAGSASCAEKEL